MTTTAEVLVACGKESLQLEVLLNDLNFNTNLAVSGLDVLAYVRENTPDLIILDAYLPELTGTSIAYRVKKVKRLSNVPIILLVDALDSKLRAEAELSGVEHVVLKPFRLAPMRNIVKHLVKIHTKIPAPTPATKRDYSSQN